MEPLIALFSIVGIGLSVVVYLLIFEKNDQRLPSTAQLDEKITEFTGKKKIKLPLLAQIFLCLGSVFLIDIFIDALLLPFENVLALVLSVAGIIIFYYVYTLRRWALKGLTVFLLLLIFLIVFDMVNESFVHWVDFTLVIYASSVIFYFNFTQVKNLFQLPKNL